MRAEMNSILTKIPKLESQWKIIHDFKPTEYLHETDPRRPPLGLFVATGDGRPKWVSIVGICFPFQNIGLLHGITGDNNQIEPQQPVKSTQLPKVGEWTRIELGHEKVDGKYFLSLSVGGREVGRKEVTDPELRKPTEFTVCIGNQKRVHCQPGFIRNLIVLEKR